MGSTARPLCGVIQSRRSRLGPVSEQGELSPSKQASLAVQHFVRFLDGRAMMKGGGSREVFAVMLLSFCSRAPKERTIKGSLV